MRKTVIFYATAGIGHKKAAIAVKEAFGDKNENVLLLDALDYTNRFFKSSYGSIYIFLVKYLPTFWGLCYYLLDNPAIYALLKPIRRMTNYLNCKRLVEFLLKEKPKTVIVTHFLSLEVISHLKMKGLLDTRLIAIVTDYESHTFWLSQYVDLYVVGSEYTKEDLLRRKISPERIKVLGIPCAKSFSEKHDKALLRSEAGLDPGKRTLFILGGGFGVGPIKTLVARLSAREEDFQIIVVCGYNKKLYGEIKKISAASKHNIKVFGFVNNVDELMSISDILISKPGGITLTEALNAQLPMIVIDPIPGQEMRNYKFLEKNQAALKIRKVGEIEKLIKVLLSSGLLEDLKENVRKIRILDSAKKIKEETEKG